MKKTNRKGELINERVNIDSQTVYHANGNVNIYPCMYEQENTPFVANGTQTSHRGRMTVHDNGIGQFKAYAEGGAPRYRTLLFHRVGRTLCLAEIALCAGEAAPGYECLPSGGIALQTDSGYL